MNELLARIIEAHGTINRWKSFEKVEITIVSDGGLRRAIEAKDSYNLLFVGPPASAKTLFLLGILDSRKGVYFDGSNTTNRILDVLEEKRPKIICLDELDKMPKQFQEKLLNFMESGHIKVDQMRRQYDFAIKGAKVFAVHYETNVNYFHQSLIRTKNVGQLFVLPLLLLPLYSFDILEPNLTRSISLAMF